MNQVCKRYIVSGKVQGVWFRANTQKVAIDIGLTGFVRNLPNGDVEVMACGDELKLTKLREWLNQGPPLAKVSKVDEEGHPWQILQSFDIK